MKKEIRYRLNGLEAIIHNLHHNLQLMQYMSYGLHKEPFNLFNNSGLYWIWGKTMGNQIIDFYKVMIKDQKFSFTKIINVAKDLKSEVDYELLEKETNALKAQYDKTNFAVIRDKYIAHQDLGVQEIRADLITITSITEKTIELFLLFSKEFKGRKVKFTSQVVKSFDKIFGTIDEYEYVKAFLIAERLKGHDTVKIPSIAKVIKEHQRESNRRLPKEWNDG